MIKCSSDNYSKSSAECLVICICLYIAIKFHNNLTEAKNCERIRNVSSFTQYPASQFTQLSCVLFPGLHFWSHLGCYRLFKCGFRWSITRSSTLLSSMLKVSSNSNGYRSWLQCVTYPYLMKQDFFGLRILHENSLRLPFYFLFVMICGFSVSRIFPTGNEGKCQIALHTM